MNEEEELMGKYLSDRYDVFFLFLPERDIRDTKSPNALIGTIYIELKYIKGGIRAVGNQFRKASKQAPIIFSWIENNELT